MLFEITLPDQCPCLGRYVQGDAKKEPRSIQLCGSESEERPPSKGE